MPNGSAAVRPTEGKRKGARGRPPGSQNKSRSLVPKEVGQRLLQHMEEQLSPEQFDYLKGVVKDGKQIDTKNEIDILIALLARNLYPAIISEMLPPEEGGLGGVLRKDVTDRLKIVQGLLNLRHQKDKTDDPDSTKSDTILTITAKRGLNLDRLGILVGQQSLSVERVPDGTGRQPDEIRALPDTLSERPFDAETGEQGETDRVLDGDRHGGGSLSDDEDSVQG